MKIVEVYLDAERYNSRVKAMIPGYWMAVNANGDEYAVCPDYAASSADQVFAMINESQSRLGN